MFSCGQAAQFRIREEYDYAWSGNTDCRGFEVVVFAALASGSLLGARTYSPSTYAWYLRRVLVRLHFCAGFSFRQATTLNSEVAASVDGDLPLVCSSVSCRRRRTTVLAFYCLRDVCVPCRRVVLLCSVRTCRPGFGVEWTHDGRSYPSTMHPRAITPVLAFLCRCAFV